MSGVRGMGGVGVGVGVVGAISSSGGRVSSGRGRCY